MKKLLVLFGFTFFISCGIIKEYNTVEGEETKMIKGQYLEVSLKRYNKITKFIPADELTVFKNYENGDKYLFLYPEQYNKKRKYLLVFNGFVLKRNERKSLHNIGNFD